MLPKLLANPDSAAGGVVRRQIEANSVAGIDQAIHAMLDRPDSTPQLSRIPVPALVIVGEEDTTTPLEEAKAMNDAIARSQLVVIPDAGHLSAVEQPEAFSTALENFLRSNL
jgi:pimeloyl-ACP methyl ester carboxylesterase